MSSTKPLPMHGDGGSQFEIFTVVLIPAVGILLRLVFLHWFYFLIYSASFYRSILSQESISTLDYTRQAVPFEWPIVLVRVICPNNMLRYPLIIDNLQDQISRRFYLHRCSYAARADRASGLGRIRALDNGETITHIFTYLKSRNCVLVNTSCLPES